MTTDEITINPDQLGDTDATQQSVLQISKLIEAREEVAFEAGVRQTLAIVLKQFQHMELIAKKNIENIQATLELEKIVDVDREAYEEEEDIALKTLLQHASESDTSDTEE